MTDSKQDDDKYFRKRLEADPENFILKKLAGLEDPRRIKRTTDFLKMPEIEDIDPREAGRAGECDLALQILLELYPKGIPCRLTTDGYDFAHVFLMFNNVPMDICGTTTIEAMKNYYNNQSLQSQPVNIEDVKNYFKAHRDLNEKQRYLALFRKFILTNADKTFPPLI